MIKNNDTPTVVILSLVAFVALTYSFMFLNPMNAEAFVDRTGGLEQGQAGYFWMGLIGTCFLFVLSFLDQSQDELIIHLIASSSPILGGWMFRVYLVGKCKLLPWRNY